jgi:hypothetical protein
MFAIRDERRKFFRSFLDTQDIIEWIFHISKYNVQWPVGYGHENDKSVGSSDFTLMPAWRFTSDEN